ncbi:MAG TPA: hypothetical protein VKU36_02485 [Candidatus Babeliales bacterium]|nr:hypothetical protein [Candidatus Babeliales bacterium]
MQKKLLLLCVMVNCVIYASENETVEQKDYTEYRKQQEIAYHIALINALSGKDSAIDEQDQQNKQANDDEVKKNEEENKVEEENRRRQQYDGSVGYFGSQPTKDSKVGRKFADYAEQRKTKDALNNEDKRKKDAIYQNLSKEIKEKKNTFNSKVLPQFKRELEADRFFIFNYCLPALRDCGANVDCYDDKGLSSKVFTNAQFGLHRETMLYACAAKFASDNGVSLTPQEMKAIAQNTPTIKSFFNDLQTGIKELSDLRNEILNPKDPNAIPIIEIDITKDQNDQGALSQ